MGFLLYKSLNLRQTIKNQADCNCPHLCFWFTDRYTARARHDKSLWRRRSRAKCRASHCVVCPTWDLSRTDFILAGTCSGHWDRGELGAHFRRIFAKNGRKSFQLFNELRNKVTFGTNSCPSPRFYLTSAASQGCKKIFVIINEMGSSRKLNRSISVNKFKTY